MFENAQPPPHPHPKTAKSATMTQKKSPPKKYQYGHQKNAELYADPKPADADPNKCPQKKPEPKNYANFEYFRFCAFFRVFLHLTSVRGTPESRHQHIRNQHKTPRPPDTHTDTPQGKNSPAHNSTPRNLKMQTRKKRHTPKHPAQSKKLPPRQHLSLSMRLPLKFKKKYKIEAP